jgi:ketosteroid isomerase-like protein
VTRPLPELEPTRTRAVNVNALYRDFGADVASDVVTLFTDRPRWPNPATEPEMDPPTRFLLRIGGSPEMADLHPNILTYLAAIAAFNANDLKTVGDHVLSDVVYRMPGRSIVAGEFHGIDGFADILTRLRDESGGTIELTPLAVLADDHNLIARARVTAQRAGKNLDTENCYAFRFVDGKVAHGQVFVSDPDQVDDFWASPHQPAPAGPGDEPTERRTS